jgi:hypothetical protein
MSSGDSYHDYSPIGLSPAEGWRAIYIHMPDEGAPGWSADSLIAWGVFEVTERPIKGNPAPQGETTREIHGVVMDDYAHCVEETENFWRYNAPSDPDPTLEEVEAEQARRAELAAIRRTRDQTHSA